MQAANPYRATAFGRCVGYVGYTAVQMEEPMKQPDDTMGSARPTSLDHSTTQQPRSMDDLDTAVSNGETSQPSKEKQMVAAVDGETFYTYRDLGSEPLEDYALPSNPRSWEAQRFPVKLAAMLTDPRE